MKREKLLFIVEAMGGGIFTYITNLTNELVKKYDVYVAYSVRKETPKDFKKSFNVNVKLIKVENFVRSINILQDLKAYIEIKKIVKKVNPDIIHLHSSKAGALGRLAFSFFNNKYTVFYTPHGYSFLMSDKSKVKRLVYRNIEKILGMGNAVTISCSPGEDKESQKIAKYTEHVNNGINMKEITNVVGDYKKSNSNKVKVATLGRISYQKNPALFNRIAENMPEKEFIWIGNGELKEEITSPNVRITGWLDRNAALRKLNEADIFILTSRWEGLPMALLEAMYMGKLCIVSDTIGNNDVIKNNVNGFICDSIEDYINAINVSKEKKKELIEHAIDDVKKEYNTITMARKYSEIYDKYILKRGK